MNWAKRNRQQGMTLIELMIAMTMFVVGLIGVLALITTAISGNGRNKLDTTATLLAQDVLEQMSARLAGPGGPITMQDCNPGGATTWTIQTTAAGAPGAGAALESSTGNIDWSVAYGSVPTGYKMRYVACGANGQQASFEVRWNVRTVNGYSNLITVSARPWGAQSSSGSYVRFFARPATLRTIVSHA